MFRKRNVYKKEILNFELELMKLFLFPCQGNTSLLQNVV